MTAKPGLVVATGLMFIYACFFSVFIFEDLSHKRICFYGRFVY